MWRCIQRVSFRFGMWVRHLRAMFLTNNMMMCFQCVGLATRICCVPPHVPRSGEVAKSRASLVIATPVESRRPPCSQAYWSCGGTRLYGRGTREPPFSPALTLRFKMWSRWKVCSCACRACDYQIVKKDRARWACETRPLGERQVMDCFSCHGIWTLLSFKEYRGDGRNTCSSSAYLPLSSSTGSRLFLLHKLLHLG